MIDVRMPTPAGPRIVEALLIAAGVAPPPADPGDRQAYLDLAHELGHGLDALPTRRAATDPGRNVAATAAASDTRNQEPAR